MAVVANESNRGILKVVLVIISAIIALAVLFNAWGDSGDAVKALAAGLLLTDAALVL